MQPIAVALAFAIVSPAPPASAAPSRDTEQSYRELEAASGLDLSRAWASYARDQRAMSFPRYVERSFRVRRDLGRGLVVAGAALVLTSAFFFCFALSTPRYDRMNFGIAGTSAALGGGMMIPGGVLLGVYARRLDRLDAATEKLDRDLELASRSRRVHVRSTGLGLQLAF